MDKKKALTLVERSMEAEFWSLMKAAETGERCYS